MGCKECVLEIDDLTFGYNKEKLLYQDFSIKVKRGEVVSIVGASGSGKSTLFELIVGSLSPLKGSIKKAKISQIFQDPYTSFHPSYTIINQIEDVADTAKAKEFCKKLNLDYELLYRLPHELSGGQLQRCSNLRAHLMEPDLILADEPPSALDNIFQLDVMKMLMKFLDKVGILLITHDLDLAKWCSDKIVEIGKG